MHTRAESGPALRGSRGRGDLGKLQNQFRARQGGTFQLCSGNSADSGKTSALNVGIWVEPLEIVTSCEDFAGSSRLGFHPSQLPIANLAIRRNHIFRPVRHAKARAKMLGEKHDGILISFRILLYQVFHGLNKHPLTLYVLGITGWHLFTAAAIGIGHNRYGKDFGHGISSDAGTGFRRCKNCMVVLQGKKGRIFT